MHMIHAINGAFIQRFYCQLQNCTTQSKMFRYIVYRITKILNSPLLSPWCWLFLCYPTCDYVDSQQKVAFFH